MRAAFTLAFNCRHHFEHNGFAKRMAEMFDVWVIVHGAAGNSGSTSWCREIPKDYYTDAGKSVDGTADYIRFLVAQHDNVHGVFGGSNPWPSKDEMVSEAVARIRQAGVKKGFLWQIDADEQWTGKDIEDAEKMLVDQTGDCGCFHADCFVGHNRQARGTWGEGNDEKDPLRGAYRRLWRWCGAEFVTHEPPELQGGNGKEVLLPQRFQHYAYYFENDVQFKQDYYGYAKLLERWQKLSKEKKHEVPLSVLLDGHWGRSKTSLVLVK